MWTDLIIKLQTLDDMAKEIQKPGIFSGQKPSEEEIETFRAEYQEWYTTCLSLLESELKIRFENIYATYAKIFILRPTDFHKAGERYGPRITYSTSQFKYPYSTHFKRAVYDHNLILLQASKVQEIPTLRTQKEAIEIIKNIAANFHLFVHYVNTRHDGRPPFLLIKDEFDVQDIFHGLLRLFFKDIRPEEGTPSHAGKNSRIDFFLTQEQIVVEIKKTRDNLKNKEVGQELTQDIIYYRKHRGYNTFIGFVYDPDKHIKNPDGLVSDLQQTLKDMKIIIIINQG
ncbi:MAG TPA: hypothetical protein VFQ36_25655 [Ktedonobacteraceae bacterium]|nr:hypothetical protein [Ktedonobacteraceae bacterium]